MPCLKPFIDGSNVPRDCGACLPCRLKRSRTWGLRLRLENDVCPRSCFVTLTYSDDFLPKYGSLCKRDLQLFMKRLRLLVSPLKVRYFNVGEYGDQTSRPHYHGLLFGVGPEDIEYVKRAWSDPATKEPIGLITCDEVTDTRIDYITGYILKGMRRDGDTRLPPGCIPEFSVMSTRPPIGVPGLDALVDAYKTKGGQLLLEQTEDVLGFIDVGRRHKSLGITLKKILRERLGVPQYAETLDYQVWCEEQKDIIAKALQGSKEHWQMWRPNDKRLIALKRKAITDFYAPHSTATVKLHKMFSQKKRRPV